MSPRKKQGFLSQFTEAIDFAQVRSESDRDLLDRAKATVGRKGGRKGEKMSREQYQCVRLPHMLMQEFCCSYIRILTVSITGLCGGKLEAQPSEATDFFSSLLFNFQFFPHQAKPVGFLLKNSVDALQGLLEGLH